MRIVSAVCALRSAVQGRGDARLVGGLHVANTLARTASSRGPALLRPNTVRLGMIHKLLASACSPRVYAAKCQRDAQRQRGTGVGRQGELPPVFAGVVSRSFVETLNERRGRAGGASAGVCWAGTRADERPSSPGLQTSRHATPLFSTLHRNSWNVRGIGLRRRLHPFYARGRGLLRRAFSFRPPGSCDVCARGGALSFLCGTSSRAMGGGPCRTCTSDARGSGMLRAHRASGAPGLLWLSVCCSEPWRLWEASSP